MDISGKISLTHSKIKKQSEQNKKGLEQPLEATAHKRDARNTGMAQFIQWNYTVTWYQCSQMTQVDFKKNRNKTEKIQTDRNH